MDLKETASRVGVTGADIARFFGVAKTTASRWLNRQTPVPSRHVKDFAKMLKISPEAVLPSSEGVVE